MCVVSLSISSYMVTLCNCEPLAANPAASAPLHDRVPHRNYDPTTTGLLKLDLGILAWCRNTALACIQRDR